jgi:hypothetical protein
MVITGPVRSAPQGKAKVQKYEWSVSIRCFQKNTRKGNSNKGQTPGAAEIGEASIFVQLVHDLSHRACHPPTRMVNRSLVEAELPPHEDDSSNSGSKLLRTSCREGKPTVEPRHIASVNLASSNFFSR